MAEVPPWGRTDKRVILALAVVGILVILAIGRDYGRSIDEPGAATYARLVLRAYAGGPLGTYANLSYYGPAYMVFSELLAQGISTASPEWTMIDGRHAAYFLSFLVGAISIYVLARGHVGVGAALAGTLLFLTQPLLFGHAFINPKDMPFLGLFAASVASGFVVVRSLPSGLAPGPWADLTSQWRSLGGRTRLRLLLGLLVGSVVLLEVLVLKKAILPSVLRLVTDAYHGDAFPVVQSFFLAVATDVWKTGLQAYLVRAEGAYWVASWALSIAVLLGIVLWATSRFFPTWRRSLTWLLGAGAVAGLATATRVAGPLAAILVSCLLIARLQRRALLPIAAYWIVLAGTTYLLWPHLWGDPILGLRDSLQEMSRFQWAGTVLFEGHLVPSDGLPWNYAPTHFGLQLTVPALALGLYGGIHALVRSRPGIPRAEIIMLVSWLIFPFLVAIALNSKLYDGARQMLFAIPPLFVMATLAFEKAFTLAPQPPVRVGLAILSFLPGLFALARLHPYQYIYYNELAGGVGGAAGQFELDYWGTSYRELILEVGKIAPRDSVVGCAWAPEMIVPYARADLELRNAWNDPNPPDFCLVLNRWHALEELWPEAPETYRVEREGAVLAVVRDLRGLK